MYGNITAQVLGQLEFALQAVRGETGHHLEAKTADYRLVRAEQRLTEALRDLSAYYHQHTS